MADTPDLRLTELANALTAVLQSQRALVEQGALQMAILQRIATAIDNLTTWLQTPPSSDLPDLLRDIVARLAAIETKQDSMAVAVQGIVARLQG